MYYVSTPPLLKYTNYWSLFYGISFADIFNLSYVIVFVFISVFKIYYLEIPL
jgi:hypothetical protein